MNNIILSLCLLVAGHVCGADKQPNVVMIVLDDLNDNLGIMGGHPQAITPHMDRLANKVIRLHISID